MNFINFFQLRNEVDKMEENHASRGVSMSCQMKTEKKIKEKGSEYKKEKIFYKKKYMLKAKRAAVTTMAAVEVTATKDHSTKQGKSHLLP